MLQIRVNPDAAVGFLTRAEEKHMPFAVALGLNRTANDGQKAERARMKVAFRLNRSEFVLRQIYISKEDRANKNTWRVIMQAGQQFKSLPGFEEGGEKTPQGHRWLWVPNPDVFKSKVIGSGNPLAVKNLRFHRDPSGRMLGTERTFMIRAGSNGQVMIMQRVDRRLSKRSSKLSSITLDNVAVGMGPRTKKEKSLSRTVGTRVLYFLKSRVRVPAKLEFVGTVTRTVQEAWPRRMREALDEAMRGAK